MSIFGHKGKRTYPSKAARRLQRANDFRAAKENRRRRMRHPPTVKGLPGRPYRSLSQRAPREQVHATGALKRSERHPNRGTGQRRRDLPWLYVCR